MMVAPHGNVTGSSPAMTVGESHFEVCLKYLRSGGDWSLRAGIKRPSALRK